MVCTICRPHLNHTIVLDHDAREKSDKNKNADLPQKEKSLARSLKYIFQLYIGTQEYHDRVG